MLGRSSGVVKAVDGINLELQPGDVLGLVGESGSGKSTLGRSILGLVRPTGGSISYRDRELVGLKEPDFRPLRRDLQMIFQDPNASLNPSMTIGESIADAMRIHGLFENDRDAAVDEVLEKVGLAPASTFAPKYPAELSGGQKQRAVIARAICLGPEFMVADEPISMLDMSVRAKILTLLEDLRREMGLTFVYITHDLASARFFCNKVAIMYLGRIVETGPTEEIFAEPRHPYTQALLAAVPDPDPSREVPRELPRGEVPDAARPPAGCAFHPRCPNAFAPCGWEARDLAQLLEKRWLTTSPEEFEREQALVGNLDLAQADPKHAVLKPGKGTASDLLELLEAMRAADPDEATWSGITDLRIEGGTVRIEFADGTRPELQRIGGVEVACHLYDR